MSPEAGVPCAVATVRPDWTDRSPAKVCASSVSCPAYAGSTTARPVVVNEEVPLHGGHSLSAGTVCGAAAAGRGEGRAVEVAARGAEVAAWEVAGATAVTKPAATTHVST